MDEPRPKRRLPVLQGGAEPEGEPPRPAWHAIVTTALAMLLVWILVASVVNGVSSRASDDGPSLTSSLLNLAVFFVSGALAGALTGRYAVAAGRREAVLGGLATATLGWSVPFVWAFAAGARGLVTWLLLLAVMMALAAGATALGFSLGRRRRGGS
jgi:MFS family permease